MGFLCALKDRDKRESKKFLFSFFLPEEAVKNTYWSIWPTVAITSLSKMVARYSK